MNTVTLIFLLFYCFVFFVLSNINTINTSSKVDARLDVIAWTDKQTERNLMPISPCSGRGDNNGGA